MVSPPSIRLRRNVVRFRFWPRAGKAMSRYHDYQSARTAAQALANRTGVDAGIRRSVECGHLGYTIGLLPSPEKSYGEDYLAERVTPTNGGK